MGAWTTSFLKVLEHRDACVGLADNNLEPHRQWEVRTAGNSKRSRFSGLRREGGSELFWVHFSKIIYCIGLEIPLETSGQPAREKSYSQKYDPANIAYRYIKNVP